MAPGRCRGAETTEQAPAAVAGIWKLTAKGHLTNQQAEMQNQVRSPAWPPAITGWAGECEGEVMGHSWLSSPQRDGREEDTLPGRRESTRAGRRGSWRCHLEVSGIY